VKEVRDKAKIQIEITNACRFSCTNCYKFVGHHARPHFMDLKMVKKAIDSLEGYQGNIGITGGEPTLHPDFTEICEYLRRKVAPDQRYIQTTGYKWHDYKSVIKKTFFASHVKYNDHKDETQKHHPMLVAIKDVVADVSLRNELIDKCWVRDKWSALINVKGCFSCEVASAFDALYNGPGGLPIEKGWWAKGHEHFSEEMERNCCQCGAALPQPTTTVQNNKDHVSISNFRMLERLQTPKFKKDRVLLVENKYSTQDIKRIAEAWEPWQSEGEECSTKNIFQQVGAMINNYFNNNKSLRYIKTALKKVERNAWRLYWNFAKKAG